MLDIIKAGVILQYGFVFPFVLFNRGVEEQSLDLLFGERSVLERTTDGFLFFALLFVLLFVLNSRFCDLCSVLI